MTEPPKCRAAVSEAVGHRMGRVGVDMGQCRRQRSRGRTWIGLMRRRVTSPSGKATFTIGGTNITDKRYITTGQPQFAGVVLGTCNAPREWYASFALKL